MGGRRIIEEDVDSHGLLLFTAGAVAGAATGVYLARRYKSFDALFGAARAALDELREAWLAGYEEGETELLEDEDELVDEAGDDEDEDDEEEDEEPDDDELVAEDDDDLTAGEADDLDAEFDEDSADDDDDLDDAAGNDLVYEAGATNREGAPADREVDRTGHVVADARRRRESRALSIRVLAALRNVEQVGRRPVEIAVVGDGVVELTGSVRTHDEAARAAAAARGVEGVQMVLNRLEVRHGGHVDTASVPRASRTGDVRPMEPGAPEA